MITNIHRAIRCSAIVREIGGRHNAQVVSLEGTPGNWLFANLRWLDSRWLSERVDVSTLELTPASDL